MMKKSLMATMAVVGALLTGCGGGGGEAGGPTTLDLSIDELTLEYAEGNIRCEPPVNPTNPQWVNVFILGGKGVFRVEMAIPAYFELDTTELQSRRFRFKHRGECTGPTGLANAITVLDSNNQTAAIKFVARPKAASTTP
jgi:hypothetical protein